MLEQYDYNYDALNRRIEKSYLNTQEPKQSYSHHYIYDGEDIVAILNQDQDLLATLTHADTVDTPLSITNEMTGERYYYHADHQGSITHLTNEDGDIIETFTYDHAYGTILEHNKEEETYNPYCYTGREYDSHDLYYYRARYYDPTIGRFISNDPIEFLAGDFNFYRYVGNDPVNFVDPSGLYASDSDPAYMRVALGSKPKTTTTPTDQRLIATGVPAACAVDVTGHNIDNKETDEMFENISMFFGVAGLLKGLASFFGKKAIQTCAKEAPKTTGSGGIKVVEGAGDVGKATKKKVDLNKGDRLLLRIFSTIV